MLGDCGGVGLAQLLHGDQVEGLDHAHGQPTRRVLHVGINCRALLRAGSDGSARKHGSLSGGPESSSRAQQGRAGGCARACTLGTRLHVHDHSRLLVACVYRRQLGLAGRGEAWARAQILVVHR